MVEAEVAVVGGGVVGCAVAHALARRGAGVVLLEAERQLALGASGTNSGILHTGFDSRPGRLETQLILRSAQLREELLDELGVAVWRCGAHLRPAGAEEREMAAALAENAHANGVEAVLQPDGSLRVPGEAVTDPVAFVHALAGAARAGGAEVRVGAPVAAIGRGDGGGVVLELRDGDRLRAGAAVNCAGLFADELARGMGDDVGSVYPRKGEFLVFRPAPHAPLREILLPVPSRLGKGVLVFPTLDGMLIAGPTAREREDKRDWSVESDARELIMPRALRMHPGLALAEPLGAYAGLRPAGQDVNYVIEPSRTLPEVIHVAAIRSTGLSACLGIAEHVLGMLAGAVALGAERPLRAPRPPASAVPWWRRAAAERADPR